MWEEKEKRNGPYETKKNERSKNLRDHMKRKKKKKEMDYMKRNGKKRWRKKVMDHMNYDSKCDRCAVKTTS